jgi:hypothetical protein
VVKHACVLQASVAGGRLSEQWLCAAFVPSLRSHHTVRVRVPPPQEAEQAPQAEARQVWEQAWTAVQSLIGAGAGQGQLASGAGSPEQDTHSTSRCWVPSPHAALHGDQGPTRQ